MNYMICTDGSPDAEKAFIQLLKIIKPEDVLHIFTSYSLPIEYIMDIFQISSEGLSIGNQEEYNKELELRKKDASALVDSYKERLKRQPNVDIKKVFTDIVESDDVRDAIIKYAKDHDIDVIVIGTRGLGKLQRLIIGSVSSYVVEHAPCSVLVVR